MGIAMIIVWVQDRVSLKESLELLRLSASARGYKVVEEQVVDRPIKSTVILDVLSEHDSVMVN